MNVSHFLTNRQSQYRNYSISNRHIAKNSFYLLLLRAESLHPIPLAASTLQSYNKPIDILRVF